MKGLQRTQANQPNRCDTFLAFTSFRSDRNDVNGTNATDATQRIERNQPNTTNAMQPLCSLRSVRNDLYTTNATHATQRNRCVRNDRNVAKATQPTQRVVTNPHAWFSHRSGTFPKPQTRLPALKTGFLAKTPVLPVEPLRNTCKKGVLATPWFQGLSGFGGLCFRESLLKTSYLPENPLF